MKTFLEPRGLAIGDWPLPMNSSSRPIRNDVIVDPASALEESAAAAATIYRLQRAGGGGPDHFFADVAGEFARRGILP
jgi:hypothetical protein